MAAMLLLLLVLACGKADNTPYPLSPALEEQVAFYKEHGLEGLDRSSCDSTLFLGLAGAAGLQVDLLAARQPSGRWARRPLELGDCLASVESKSSFSRDMIQGVLWWAWRNRRLDVVEDLYKQLARDGGRLGEDDGSLDGFGRTIVTPQLLGTIVAVRHALGGKDGLERWIPVSLSPASKGFERHLHALHIALRLEVTQEKPSQDVKALFKLYANEDPGNPLFLVLAGRKNEAAALLERVWPKGRLPNNTDWCAQWRLERADDSNGLKPCLDEPKTHSGADFLFVVSLLEKRRL